MHTTNILNTLIPRWGKIIRIVLAAFLALASGSAQSGEIVTYILTDHLGSPVIEMNGAGQVIKREVYGPYGQAQISPNNSGIGYTGHMQDGDTGLTYMQARYFDPEAIRFLSTDPVRFSPDQPNHFNPYWYAEGNPYKYTDPDGKYVCNGSREQCGTISQALERIAKDASKLQAGSKGQKALNAVVKLYGKEDQKNGVTVNFSSKVGLGQTNSNGTALTITFNSAAMHHYASLLGHEDTENAAIVAHEGQHGVDYRTGKYNSNRRSDIYQTERNAYKTQSYVNEAEGVQSVWGIWRPGITPVEQRIEIGINAMRSTNADCAGGKCQ